MNGITNGSVEKYMHDLVPPRDPVLQEIEELAAEQRIPIVGPAVGRLLEQLARSIDAGRVFEMGSAVGYSTIWLARGVGAGGKVYYTDGSRDRARQAESYFHRAGIRERVEVMTGNSLDLIDETEGEFDVVFNDVDKHYYPEVYRRVRDRVRAGGLLVTDNVLWSGRVADPGVDDRDTAAIREFNELLYADESYLNTIVPLRDGVSIALRI